MAKRRVHLTFPGSLADRPILWEMCEKYRLVFNIRQADFQDGVGWIMTELEGDEADLVAGLQWIESQGAHVDPIEQDVVQ